MAAKSERKTKKSQKTIDFEEGRLDLTPVRKRRKFVKMRGATSDYYVDMEDKIKDENMRRMGGTVSASYTDVIAQTAVPQERKNALVEKPLTVTVRAAYDDPKLGVVAMCEYVSKDAPDDDPIIIYVPYKNFTEYTDKDLKDRRFPNRKVFIKKRVGSETDVIVEDFQRDKDGQVIFIGNRNLAMKYNQTFWFEELIDKTSQGYRYEPGIKLEARVSSVTTWGLFCELLGLEVYCHVSDLSYMPCDTSGYSNGDKVWVKLLEIDRDKKTRNVDIKVSVKEVKENPLEKAFKIYKKNMDVSGTVVFKNATPKEGKNPFCYVDIGRDVRVYCPLTMSVGIGDKVMVRMDQPWRSDDGKAMISGKLETRL